MSKKIENEFRGVVLSDEQRNNLNKHIQSVLGTDYYNQTEEFFLSVWNSNARYKVFLARRCLNIMYMMYRANYEKPDSLFDQTLYSDGALLANVSEIADSYINWGIIPKILIVDDILIHGRTLNMLIDKLIDSIYECLLDKGVEFSKSDVEFDILQSLTIKVMIQNTKPLLIRKKYFQCFDCKSDKSDVWQPRYWHELSSRLSLLVLGGFFSNTSFVLSWHETEDSLGNHMLFANAAQNKGFKKYEWGGSSKGEAWIKPIFNLEGEVVAFYTLRITENEFDNNYRVIPFVILADFDCDFSDISEEKKVNFEKYFRNFDAFSGKTKVKSEALYLLLSHNLLLLLQQEMGQRLIKCGNLDIDKIDISFRMESLTQCNGIVSRVANLTEPLLSWSEMNTLIINSTKESKPLFNITEKHNLEESINYSRLLEEIMANEGEELEQNAYLVYSGKIKNILDSKKKNIWNLCQQIERSTKGKISEENFTEIVGVILRLMDMGIVAIDAYNNELSNHSEFSCVYRAGEQSMFIHPRKYAQDLPVLIAMERDCVLNIAEIKKRIDNFYSDNLEYAESLKNFMEMLYSSGQQVSDWDINMLNWTEIEDTTQERFVGLEQEYVLLSQMFLDTSEQINAIDRYYKMYPTKSH